MGVKPRARLWGAIIEAGLMQKEFAALVGEHEVVVSRVVRGHQNIDEVKQRRWAKVLKRKPEELFNDDGKERAA